MDDYLDCLCTYLMEERLPQARSSQMYLIRSRQEEAALDALRATFSDAQQELYLRYEAFHNELAVMDLELVFREAVALGKWMVR